MLAPIQVIHGSCDGQFDLAGRKVGELWRALATAFNITSDAMVFSAIVGMPVEREAEVYTEIPPMRRLR
jgi:hypothetical protein